VLEQLHSHCALHTALNCSKGEPMAHLCTRSSVCPESDIEMAGIGLSAVHTCELGHCWCMAGVLRSGVPTPAAQPVVVQDGRVRMLLVLLLMSHTMLNLVRDLCILGHLP
jgi:hypothetical protein